MKNGYNQLSAGHYSEKETIPAKVAESAPAYHQFHQRDYNYDELEKNLLNQGRVAEDPAEGEMVETQDLRKKKDISVEELQSLMAGNPKLQQEIASLLKKMNGEGGE